MPMTIRKPPGSYTLTPADDGALVILDGTAARTLTGPPAGGPAPTPAGFFVDVRVNGPQAATFAPQGGALVDGAATLAIPGNGARRLVFDGAAWLSTLGGGA